MRLAVLNDWEDKKSAVFWNKDGFLKMLHVLRERDGWEIVFFKKHERTFTWKHDYVELSFSTDPVAQARAFNPDVYLGFSDFSREYLNELRDEKLALCYTGGRYIEYADAPKLVFVESKTYLDWMRSMGLNVVQAFGTNTELFTPTKQPKIFDGFFPCTGAAWKRHHLFAGALGSRGLVAGWWQPHEPECLEVCKEYGTAVLHHQLPESVNYLYNMSHTCVITSADNGGSQRSVLEAMATNTPVIVMADSTMTTEYVRESGCGAIVEPNIEAIKMEVMVQRGMNINSRDWILENYSEFIYADKIKAGLESIC